MFNFACECFQISKLFRGCCGTLLLSHNVHAESQSLDPSLYTLYRCLKIPNLEMNLILLGFN